MLPFPPRLFSVISYSTFISIIGISDCQYFPLISAGSGEPGRMI